MPEHRSTVGRVVHRLRLAAGTVLALGLGLAPTAAHAQSVVLRVRVTDSTGTPVAGVELSVVRGLNHVLATAVTDSSGQRNMAVPRDTGSYELVARRIGYARGSRFFTSIGRDTITVALSMSRLAQQLATVKVTAEEDIKHKRLFIDADAIAGSPRPIFDGLDVLTKLRPDMVWGLGGQQYCHGESLREIWVNGRRIYSQLVPIDLVAAARVRGTKAKVVPGHVITVLASIHPEHIAEMTYHDCADMSLGKIGGESAMFVVLKPGIGFEVGRGSYAEDLPVAAQSHAPVAPPSGSVRSSVPAYRARVLGVFDAATGQPIDSCEVIVAGSGAKARTTSTGTVSLVFLPEGPSEVRVEKAGYLPQTFAVTISPRDTMGITVVLTRQ
jgi:hypothetical protein